MDARAGTFQALELFGQQLLQGGHYASVDIQEKLNNMSDARQELEKYVTWCILFNLLINLYTKFFLKSMNV